MFQNRLKIFLMVLLVFSGLLMLRALQLQVFGREEWAERAKKVFTPAAQLTETTRGRILDYLGREVAVDSPCMDLCVDYRAIVDDPHDEAAERWVRQQAVARLKRRMGDEYSRAGRSRRGEMVDEEAGRVHADIRAMWGTIARVSGKSLEEIDETRRAIVQRVEMRRRYVWFHHWNAAVAKQKALPPAPWYRRWLLGEGQENLGLDSFDLTVDEQRDAHAVLTDVGQDLINFFGKDPERFPGLVLRPGIKRVYPYQEAGCHLIGHLSKVTREDLLSDDDEDETRKYWPNDLVGRSGVEALAEPLLRGSRGRVVKVNGEEKEHTDPKPGQDVRLTIDIEMQREIQAMFKNVAIDENREITHHVMHGAAVVVDVPTGEVRALASYPDYDLNKFDDDYSKLVADTLNAPLLNRATQVAREPGSTAKPMIGLGAITMGLMTTTDTIECKGYLWLDGKKMPNGRCWVASRWEKVLGPLGIMHHQIPSYAPHPTGFLTFADALERSCNVYFETLGDRLKLDGETRIFHAFGLGRKTGIGIDEVAGYVPGDFHIPREIARSTSWFAAIGQGRVAATPIQMADVAATVARGGVWIKPHLLAGEAGIAAQRAAAKRAEAATTRPASPKDPPAEDRIDLHLSPAAVRAAHLGMYNVVYAPAGTGRYVAHKDDNDRVLEPSLAHLHICGKTGTAQASRVKVPVLDRDGKPVLDEEGKPVTEYLRPSLPGNPNPKADWYRAADAEGTRFNHAWFIGFAPAENPQIAFAVMVEYGENGGGTAGRVAKHVVEACIRHGYLPGGAAVGQLEGTDEVGGSEVADVGHLQTGG